MVLFSAPSNQYPIIFHFLLGLGESNGLPFLIVSCWYKNCCLPRSIMIVLNSHRLNYVMFPPWKSIILLRSIFTVDGKTSNFCSPRRQRISWWEITIWFGSSACWIFVTFFAARTIMPLPIGQSFICMHRTNTCIYLDVFHREKNKWNVTTTLKITVVVDAITINDGWRDLAQSQQERIIYIVSIKFQQLKLNH